MSDFHCDITKLKQPAEDPVVDPVEKVKRLLDETRRLKASENDPWSVNTDKLKVEFHRQHERILEKVKKWFDVKNTLTDVEMNNSYKELLKENKKWKANLPIERILGE